ncbi:hypothetical protein L3X38_024973 [Prunus dulcis]|uniref:Uncharacterized protein n=1 Tax=Prunus dulcis TaxID=3755 RepID=A0AAD4Z6N1_PRUDU|nr:hypothetical protein L3X38_024973 [Prunus dulcis]
MRLTLTNGPLRPTRIAARIDLVSPRTTRIAAQIDLVSPRPARMEYTVSKSHENMYLLRSLMALLCHGGATPKEYFMELIMKDRESNHGEMDDDYNSLLEPFVSERNRFRIGFHQDLIRVLESLTTNKCLERSRQGLALVFFELARPHRQDPLVFSAGILPAVTTGFLQFFPASPQHFRQASHSNQGPLNCVGRGLRLRLTNGPLRPARIAARIDLVSPRPTRIVARIDLVSPRPAKIEARVGLVSPRLARMELTILMELTDQEWGYA